MKLRLRSVVPVAATAALLLPARPSAAQFSSIFFENCSTGSFKACASVWVGTTRNLAGGTDVVFRVANLQGRGGATDVSPYGAAWFGVETAVNHGTTPYAAATAAALGGASITAGTSGLGWSGHTQGNVVFAGGAHVFGCDLPSWKHILDEGSYSYASTCNGFIQLSFTTAQAWDAEDVTKWTVQGKRDGDADAARFDCWSGYADCDLGFNPIDQTVVPEPITIVLLGTGLAGIGAMRARRRKKDELA
jgi:hypothetical protein